MATLALLAGCGGDPGKTQAHGRHASDARHGHEHAETSPSGASFKSGRGVIVKEETKKLLGIEIADVSTRPLSGQIPLTVQVFGERHRPRFDPEDHSGCDVHVSGFVSTRTATTIKAGQPVEVIKDTNAPLGGIVVAVQKALALGESEVVIGVSNATAALKPGEFIPARITVPRDEAVAVIPKSALLRTSEGTFVYAVNGDAYFRTAVKPGSEAGGWVEITDGLFPGDQVVTQPAQTLWLIELRATKGGGHCH